jgi:hypothetical protein
MHVMYLGHVVLTIVLIGEGEGQAYRICVAKTPVPI